MSEQEMRLRAAVAAGDYAGALNLLNSLPSPPASMAEAASILETLGWALCAAKAQRAHAAARLAAHLRSSAYQRPPAATPYTWELNA
jgi:hypothetical protein